MPTMFEPSCVCHLVRGAGCQQGRNCPLREIEMASSIAPNVPQGDEPMDYQYRNASSAWTGRAPRTVDERWPRAPISAPASWLGRLVARLFGR